MSVKVEAWGPCALFSRPELKVERYSYDVMTPSAARGLLEAIYWHPGLRWIVDKIFVLNPIEFTGIRRNEVKSKISASNAAAVMSSGGGELYIPTSDDIQQRAATVLRDVRYVIEAHFELTSKAAPGDNEGKFSDIMRRRLEKGQCFHQPCFGCREFAAHFKKWEGGEITTAHPDEDRNLGLMLYDIDYADPENLTPMVFPRDAPKGRPERPRAGQPGGAAMILQSLVDYYEALAARDEIARPGWGKVKVAFALELDADGKPARVLPLASPSTDGKKSVPQTKTLPAPVKRTVGIAPNFLWDNSRLSARRRRKGQA